MCRQKSEGSAVNVSTVLCVGDAVCAGDIIYLSLADIMLSYY